MQDMAKKVAVFYAGLHRCTLVTSTGYLLLTRAIRVDEEVRAAGGEWLNAEGGYSTAQIHWLAIEDHASWSGGNSSARSWTIASAQVQHFS